MIYDFLYENLNILYENLDFLYENLRFSLWKILMIFSMIFWPVHKIPYYEDRVSTGRVKTRWLGGSFLIVYRNNAGRLGSGFISVCLETRWLGQKSGFYMPERPCSQPKFLTKIWTLFPEKRRKMKSPQGWSVAKYWEFEGEIRWNGLYPFHEITAFTITLLDRIPRTVNSEEKFIESRLFSPSKFDSATGVTLTLYLESFWSGFQTETETWYVTVSFIMWQFVTFVTVTKCHNSEFVTWFVSLGFV